MGEHQVAMFPPTDEDRARWPTQRRRILERLRRGPATSRELVYIMFIQRAAARVGDLREMGYVIDTSRHGRTYVYTLVSEPLVPRKLEKKRKAPPAAEIVVEAIC